MSLFSIFLLALALAADSFAASVAKGAHYRPTIRQALLVSVLFAGFQAVMPMAGWQMGVELQPTIQFIDHWLAFGILCAVGGKMIFDGLRPSKAGRGDNAFTLPALILTAIATSIDAFVVGFGFGFLNISVLAALLMIGTVTFLTSFGGIYLGNRLGAHVGEYAEVGAGLVLIAIGGKILVSHLGA
ncbi:MAG: putative Mn2+ efflux pump MntP [Gammaproteobacteria bacterium]|jgi:putative Mn2+ efflux pump MntP